MEFHDPSVGGMGQREPDGMELEPADDGLPGGPRIAEIERVARDRGAEARFLVGADGRVIGVDLWPTPEADPCELRFAGRLAGDSHGMPATIEVRHGNDLFGLFELRGATLEATPPAVGVKDAAQEPAAARGEGKAKADTNAGLPPRAKLRGSAGAVPQ